MTERNAISGRFAGRCAVVTGGSAGIGRAVVGELCREGAAVAFAGIEPELVEQTGRELADAGHDVLGLCGDLADEAFCRRVVADTAARWGRVDYLVNNAFSFIAAGLAAQREEWERSLQVGPVAYATMAAAIAEPMRDSGGGAIVNVSSISAHIAQPHRWTYNAAKGAVHNLTRCMALDLAPYGIRVNSVSPGWIWTREVLKAAQVDGGGRDKWGPLWGRFHMLERCGEPLECAGPILFLLSDDASFVTGADLPVDGGYLGLGPEGLGRDTVIAGSQ